MKVTEDYSFSSLCSLRVKDKAAYYCELTSINQAQEILAFSHNKNIPLFKKNIHVKAFHHFKRLIYALVM